MSASDIGLETRLASVVGPKTADALAESLDLQTVGDLLRHYPRRYHVQGELTPIRDLEEGEYATVDVEIVSVSNRRMQQRKGTIQELVVTDGFDRLTLVFFNQHFRVGKEFAAGQHGRFDGKVVGRRGRSAGQPVTGSPPAPAPAHRDRRGRGRAHRGLSRIGRTEHGPHPQDRRHGARRARAGRRPAARGGTGRSRAARAAGSRSA